MSHEALLLRSGHHPPLDHRQATAAPSHRSMAAAPAGPGAGRPPLSPCAGFVTDVLILPTRNVRLFAPVFALVLAHTFASLAVAVLLAHPLATVERDGHEYEVSPQKIWEHSAGLQALYLAYVASKLATQATVALAACATLRGDRPRSLAELLRGTPRRGCLFAGAALVAAAELACTAVPAYYLDSWWRYSWTHPDTGGVESFVQGVLLFVSLATLIFRLCLAAVFPVAIAASATAATEEGGHGCGGADAATHLHRAWRLMTAAASWKEAALQVLVVTVVLPLATYPVYAFALEYGQAQGGFLLLLGSLYGYLLPSAGVQLYSAVAATVFYHRCMEQQRHELAIPVTMKAMKLGEQSTR
ncbi:uncharacterized protein LOC123440744 isoform X2 [Hordeum vulgare subsp. vulgare]|uniref:Uncharacterized protein n=1 Tax=Hordeum vulgare subsp. vulgare TaxID=112509 RepID=A0A8I6X6G7_HORVV|nr:uncharacterized protein LOC123440744 isoform X2 [Hordeum vulgare subsp. vulgare]